MLKESVESVWMNGLSDDFICYTTSLKMVMNGDDDKIQLE